MHDLELLDDDLFNEVKRYARSFDESGDLNTGTSTIDKYTSYLIYADAINFLAFKGNKRALQAIKRYEDILSETDTYKAPRIAVDIKRQASAVIWAISGLANNVVVDRYCGSLIDQNSCRYLLDLLTHIKWLSSIVCDDWWCAGLNEQINIIYHEIEFSSMPSLLAGPGGYSRTKEPVWTGFCELIAKYLDKDIVYGRDDTDYKPNKTTFKDLSMRGAIDGVAVEAEVGFFKKKKCLLDVSK